MQVMMKVPFWEANFDMPKEKAADLVQKAFQYAAERDPAEIPAPARKPQNMSGDSGAARTAARATPTHRRRGYKGFLLVKCESCGKVRGFCSQSPVTRFTCNCGHYTELHNLRAVRLRCKCGSAFTYRTNITEERFDFPCFNCGNPVDLELNKHGTAYDTIT